MCTCGKGNILIWVRNMLRKNVSINFARKYSSNVFRLAQICNHLPEDLKEKFEEFSPLFLVDEDLERCPPDSKCIIGKILLQIKRRVVKQSRKAGKYFLDPPLLKWYLEYGFVVDPTIYKLETLQTIYNKVSIPEKYHIMIKKTTYRNL